MTSPVLVFDGDCGFCTRVALWARRRLPPGTVVAPWQTLDLRELDLDRTQVESAAYWVDGSRRWRGHRAIARAARAMGGPWAVAGTVISVPPFSWLARVGYRLVARFRHRLPGGTAACRISDPRTRP
ncbi:MAG: thiol-disulfide oxidoreductase DCC family protein [Acidimicrobiales bacterium]